MMLACLCDIVGYLFVFCCFICNKCFTYVLSLHNVHYVYYTSTNVWIRNCSELMTSHALGGLAGSWDEI